MLIRVTAHMSLNKRDPIHVWIGAVCVVICVFAVCKFLLDFYWASMYLNYGNEALTNVHATEQAEYQPNNGLLFCFVLTDKKFHKTRVPALYQTWLPICDAYHIYSNSAEHLPNLPVHDLFAGLPVSYSRLFWKSRLALHYSYTNVSSNFDWYLKSDDDSYFFVEKLKKYLNKFDPDKPHLIGFRLKRKFPRGYVSGGGGYVLSRKAIELFATFAFNDSSICPFHEWEDLGISRCLSNLGIYPQDTRTATGKQRFMPFLPDEHFNGNINKDWVFDELKFVGFDVYHKQLLSLHHLKPQEIRLIHGIATRIGEK